MCEGGATVEGEGYASTEMKMKFDEKIKIVLVDKRHFPHRKDVPCHM